MSMENSPLDLYFEPSLPIFISPSFDEQPVAQGATSDEVILVPNTPEFLMPADTDPILVEDHSNPSLADLDEPLDEWTGPQEARVIKCLRHVQAVLSGKIPSSSFTPFQRFEVPAFNLLYLPYPKATLEFLNSVRLSVISHTTGVLYHIRQDSDGNIYRHLDFDDFLSAELIMLEVLINKLSNMYNAPVVTSTRISALSNNFIYELE